MDKKIFATLFTAVFANITGVGIVVPLLPVYAKDMGASGFYIALTLGAFSLSKAVFLPLFGKLSDENGRKPFILTGLFAYFLVSIAFMISENVKSLIIIRICHGCASAMLVPVIQAYIGDLTEDGKESFTMSVFNISMFTSLSLGPLIGGLINENISLNAAFMAMGILAISAFTLSFAFLPKTSQEVKRPKGKTKHKFHEFFLNRFFSSIILFRFIYTTGIGIIWSFIPVYASSKFGMSSTLTGILVMSGIFTSGILHPPMGYLSDRINKRGLVIAGGFLCGLGLFSISFGNNFYSILTAIMIFGIGGGVAMPSVTGLAVIFGKEKQAMGQAMSIFTFAHSIGMFTGAVTAGFIMDFFKIELIFPIGGTLIFTGTILFIYLSRPENQDKNFKFKAETYR